MTRRQVISEQRWPTTGDFVALASQFRQNVAIVLLGLVWTAYDKLVSEVLADVDCTQADEDLERQVTQLLEPRIHSVMDGTEPFYVQHNSYEAASRKSAPAQLPEYDIAFVLNINERIKWPLEAKVLRTHLSVAEYVRAVNDQFLTSRYAPLSSQGSILGYLVRGDPDTVLATVASKLNCRLCACPEFSDRHHATSDHFRPAAADWGISTRFRCHHMILPLSPNP